MMNPLKRFTELFKKKEEEDEIPEAWKQEQEEPMETIEPLEEEESPSKIRKVFNAVPHFPQSHAKLRVPGIGRVKRLLAFVLLVLNLVVGFFGFNPISMAFYVLTALVLLDYLFKTRPKKEDVEWWVVPKIDEGTE